MFNQVDFTDKTEIILSSEQKLVTYLNKKGERSQYPLASALESTNQEMAKRLKYTKDILTNMLNNNHPNGVGNNLKEGINLVKLVTINIQQLMYQRQMVKLRFKIFK